MVFLTFVTMAVILLIILGKAVTPRSEKKPVWRWKLDDYGAALRRGIVLLLDAGARNRWRMEALHNQANYSERGRMDGDRLPTDEAPHPPEQIPPGAIPPHLRAPGAGPQYRPDGWVASADDEGDDDPLPPTVR